ncbi:ABC transporter ATP-binding protein [Paenibacillus sp. EKM202P]|uniref:ABC transporter ATP-binding protein n=1 Tax=unclassified Paenibacillus TaxID=185978 RepID=UPI0013EDAB3E|nr:MULTISPECIES: ABC transporter ATP-binding protein [unclassified Paenibacillus]KAF6562905.1 ABC transporter ATP-binding protein [Paenibacillus sp. EKM207P]KAF6563785.1 ABC transporter ATP-binding protein [Paenibacillus sp. EKM202P]
MKNMGNGNNGLHSAWKSVKSGLKLLRLIFSTNKRYLILSIMFYFIQGVTPIFTLAVMQNVLNKVSIALQQGAGLVIIPFGWFVLVYVVKNIVNAAQDYVEGNLEAVLSKSLNIMICEKSTRLGLGDYENATINDQLKRASQEASYRPYQLYTQMAGIVSSLITMISSAIWLILWKWWVVLILLIVSVLSLYSLFKINREQFQIYMDRTPQYRQSWYMTYLLTNDRAVKEVKIFQLGPYLLERYSNLLESFFKVDRRMLGRLTRFTLMYNLLELGVMLWFVWMAMKETLLTNIMIGSLYGYIQAIMLTQSQIQMMMRGISQFSQNNLYIEQLFLFLKLPTSDPVYHQKDLSYMQPSGVGQDFHIEQIAFEGVSFKYPGQSRYALNKVRLSLSKGETVAIVGKNGSGKTTLMKILMQLYADYSGTISVNGCNIKNYELADIQRKIGVVFQDFMQYEMSARHNIGFGDLGQLEEDGTLMDAARYAAMDDVIQKLPHGLNTQLGKWFEEGHQLSGGQWQRLAIARAFVRKADVYILDEPSSFLDPVAERDLLELFLDLMKDRIGIFITHRISSARLAHHIVVMEDGQIIEQGTHEYLVRLGGVYLEMYQVQASSFAADAVTNMGGVFQS